MIGIVYCGQMRICYDKKQWTCTTGEVNEGQRNGGRRAVPPNRFIENARVDDQRAADLFLAPLLNLAGCSRCGRPKREAKIKIDIT